MLPFDPVLMSLAPVWFVGIVVRACLERVVTCTCRAVLKHLGVHITSFLLLASPVYLTISTQVPSSSSHDYKWPQSYGISFTQAVEVQQQSQPTMKGRELPSPLNFQAQNAMRQKELLDMTVPGEIPTQPQPPGAPLRRYVTSYL